MGRMTVGIMDMAENELDETRKQTMIKVAQKAARIFPNVQYRHFMKQYSLHGSCL